MMNLRGSVSKGFNSLTGALVWIGHIALAAIILIVFVDVCGRYFLNLPLRGAYEVVMLAMTVLGGFAIMHACVKKGHIAIDLLLVRFPGRAQTLIQVVALILGTVIWAMLAYRSYVLALELFQASETSTLLGIPTGPFMLTFAIALSLSSLALLVQVFLPQPADQKPEEEEGASLEL